MSGERGVREDGRWKHVPYLGRLEYEAVEQFVEARRRYVADAVGKASLRDCMSPSVYEYVIVLREDFADADEERQVELLCELCRSSSLEDTTLRQLQRLRMRAVGQVAYGEYAAEFMRLVKRLNETEVDSQTVLEKFLSGIVPDRVATRLRDRLHGRAGQDVEQDMTLRRLICQASETVRAEDAAKELLQEGVSRTNVMQCYKCGRLGHIAARCRSASSTQIGRSDASRRAPGAARTGVGDYARSMTGEKTGEKPRELAEPRKRPGACFTCGQVGHYAPECPKRKIHDTRSKAREQVTTAKPKEPKKTVEAFCIGNARQRMFVRALVNTVEVSALIDSGAEASLIAPSIVNQLTGSGFKICDESRDLELVGGLRAQTSRIVETTVTVGTTELKAELLEYPGLKEDVILGVDIIRRVPQGELPRFMEWTTADEATNFDDTADEVAAQVQRQGKQKESMDALVMEADIDVRDQVKEALLELPELFGELTAQPADLVQHTIELTSHEVICQGPRKQSPTREAFIQEEVRKLCELHIVEPVTTPSDWASPVVVVAKRNGGFRLCIDYRKLNDITKKDQYPMPRIDDLLDTLSGKTFFASIDLLSGYYQVAVAEEDRSKTAFVIREGHYQFSRMPFGLCNAPATFQRGMNRLLGELRWKACLVYLDDILVFGEDAETFIDNLRQVLRRLADAGLKLNPRKCRFGCRQLSYLGQVISVQGRRMDPERLESLYKMQEPTNLKTLRAFLGFISYYRAYIPNMSTTAIPLYSLLKKGTQFKWEEAERNACKELREQLAKGPLLAHPDFTKTFCLRTDASEGGIGAVLLQGEGEQEQTIMFLSRTLSPTEKRWSTIEKEALAIVWAIHKLRAYLLDRRFIVESDHRNLQWIETAKSPRVQRWKLSLAEFSFDVHYRPGAANEVADTLSRLPKVGAVKIIEPGAEVTAELERELMKAQDKALDQEAEQWRGDDRFEVTEDGFWFRKKQGTRVPVVPQNATKLKEKICALGHTHILSGHFGVQRTLATIKSVAWWKNMKETVAEYVRTCPACQRVKAHPLRSGPMLTTTETQVFKTWHIDFVGPLPEDEHGFAHIWVAIDRFSRWVVLHPCKAAAGDEAARALLKQVVCMFGMPQRVVTDGGSHFANKLMKELCKTLGMDHHVLTPYHPQANGVVERQNRVVVDTLRAIVKDVQCWSDSLPYVQFAMNSARNATTGFTPFQIVFGVDPRSPIKLVPGGDSEQADWKEVVPGPEFPRRLSLFLAALRKEAVEMQEAAVTRYRDRYQRDREEVKFKVGDLVLVFFLKRPNKLCVRWRGPYEVIAQLNPVVYKVKQILTGEEVSAHVDRIIPFDRSRLNEEELLNEAAPKGEFVVEKILDHKKQGRQILLLVKWLGYDEPDEVTWEPLKNVANVRAAVEYCAENGVSL